MKGTTIERRSSYLKNIKYIFKKFQKYLLKKVT